MKIDILPRSCPGKWSIALIAAVPILFLIGMAAVGFYESTEAGKTILDDVVSRPGIALPMLAGFVSGIAAFFFGIISVIKKRERSVLVFLSTLLGFLVLLWTLAELLFQH